MLRLATTLLVLAVLALGCTPPPPIPDSGTGSGAGGGTGGGGGLSQFVITDLDPNAVDATYFSIAVDPVQERVGVAYFSNRGTMTMMGTPDYDIKYVEWRQGVVSPVQTVRSVQRRVGISLVFDPTSGEPIISYLGGDPGFIVGMSIFWFQSDAVINRRSGGSTWTETIVATDGDQITCGNPVSDSGFLVGLWTAMAFDSTNKFYYFYRDAHQGQFPMQDWAGSDVELWEGGLPPTTGICLAQGGNNKDAYGGHIQVVIGANDQPMVIYDQMFDTADSGGKNIVFQLRNPNGTWTTPNALLTIPNTQTGAWLAYDPTEGYGIAFQDRSTNELKYVKSTDGLTWNSSDPVYGSGTGGWYPSLAMDPKNHEPAIAHYICSPRNSVAETQCLTSDDRLVITQRVVGTWRETVVDEGGGYHPKLAFFSPKNGAEPKRVVVYRTPPAIDPMTGLTVSGVGALKIAVER
jgi:hypothetical protein